ncbi:hypothetical protein U9M48_016233, partial [Paspalum notatum var. saurae]
SRPSMDAYEATKLVFSRIQALDPDHAAKIMGLLLIQDHGDKEMIRLAFGPEALLHAVMAKARTDLGLGTPTSASTAPSPFLLSRQNSGRCGGVAGAGTAPSPLSSVVSSPSSWAPPPIFSRTSTNNGAAAEEEELASPANAAGGSGAPFFAAGSGDALLDDPQLQALFDGGGWTGGGGGHRRSSSVSELCLDGLGWKPCLYYARGYCKNGSACRFVHGGIPDDALSSKSQRLAALSYSPTGSLPGSPSAATAKCLSLSLLLQQQKESSQRWVGGGCSGGGGADAGRGGGGDDAHKLMARQLDLAGAINPGSRQIYLTFPADSTFREEDVSNYFSIYGPVHDVRIPYQQKRMFGFVTFVYPETVKLILAKGNPHFICDARVLVKPYKEKGKVPVDKYRYYSHPLCFRQLQYSSQPSPHPPIPLLCFTAARKQQQLQAGERAVDFSNGLDPFDLHHQLGARMLQHSNSSANEMLLRRKLEEQQAAEQLQQAMELQSRRLMELQLLDLKSRSPTSHIGGMPFSPSTTRGVVVGVGSPPDSGSGVQAGCRFLQNQRRAGAVNGGGGGGDKEESAAGDGEGEASPDPDADSDQRCVERNYRPLLLSK